MLLKKINFLAFILCGATLFAQNNNVDDTIITDRPDVTESPLNVPKHYLQLETGAAYQKFTEEDVTFQNYTNNTFLLRYGLFDNLELRLTGSYLKHNLKTKDIITTIADGYPPLQLGIKMPITKNRQAKTTAGFIGHVDLSFTASEDFEPRTTGSNFVFAVAHELGKNSSLSYNFGGVWRGDIRNDINYIYSIAYGYSITDKLGAYAELFGELEPSSEFYHLWDAGLTYLITNNFQVDATIGKNINQQLNTTFFSGGFSYRIPLKKQ